MHSQANNLTDREQPSLDPDARQLMLFKEDREDPNVLGIDDMNLLELLVSLPGERRPAKGEVKTVPWKRGERSHWAEYTANDLLMEWDAKGRQPQGPDGRDRFYLNVLTSEKIGLPKKRADDVLIALMEISSHIGFDKEIRVVRKQMIERMKWPMNRDYYNRLDETLSQLAGVTVQTNALYDPSEGAYFDSTFGIIDVDLEAESSGQHGIVKVNWSQKMLKNFRLGFAKKLDTKFYYDLKSNRKAKRLYRWLDKHLSFSPVMEIDVVLFAHKVLGYGLTYKHPSQVVQKVESELDLLWEKGFCRWEVKASQSDSGSKFVFTRVTQYKSVNYPERAYVIEALKNRGVRQAEKLVDWAGLERCLRQIEHFDYLDGKGKDWENSGGWLANAIKHKNGEGYKLPEELKRILDQAREETAAWCDKMYEALPEEEQQQIDSQVKEELPSDLIPDAGMKLRKRNQILLQRKRTAA